MGRVSRKIEGNFTHRVQFHRYTFPDRSHELLKSVQFCVLVFIEEPFACRFAASNPRDSPSGQLSTPVPGSGVMATSSAVSF